MKNLTSWFLLVLVVSCSPGIPSDEQIINLTVSKILEGKSGEMFAIEKFVKTNGYLADDGKEYVAEVKYDLVLKRDIADIARDKVKAATKEGSFSKILKSNLDLIGFALKHGNLKAGHKINREDQVTLIKTQQGWQLKPDEQGAKPDLSD